MPAKNLGPEDVVTADRDETLGDVARTLETQDVGAAVVTENDEPVGIVTDRDIALAVGDDGDVADRTVGAVMTEDPATLSADAEAVEISSVIEEEGVRRVPVVDDSGELSGIVTADDLVAVIGEQLDDVANAIEAQSPQYSA